MQTPAEQLDPTAANGSSHPEAMPQALEHDLNGDANGLTELLHALQSMRVGNFSVRMAGDRVGIMGKIADTFNEIVATNERMAGQLERVGQVVGREGKNSTARALRALRWRLGRDGVFGQFADRRSAVADY